MQPSSVTQKPIYQQEPSRPEDISARGYLRGGHAPRHQRLREALKHLFRASGLMGALRWPLRIHGDRIRAGERLGDPEVVSAVLAARPFWASLRVGASHVLSLRYVCAPTTANAINF